MHSEKRLAAILDQYDLVARAYKFYLDFCTSKNLGYHNQYHTECMVINCDEAANWLLEHSATAIPHGYTNLDHEILLTAAVFHDFNHSGGRHKDHDNILQAKSQLLLFLTHYAGLDTHCPSIESYLQDGVDTVFEKILMDCSEIISATEYPYTITPENINQKIIRDCDLLQILEDRWQEVNIDGLRKEMSFGLNKLITKKVFAEKSVEFLSNIKWETAFGESKTPLMDARIAEIKQTFKL